MSVRLDLGCGAAKSFGFIGGDRFALPGVDVVLDLDRALPFATDSVDLILMSHSLEHVQDLMSTMREVYRICRHGAQLCIVAPYSQQSLNFANPHHRQVFNEHTPRFWTSAPHTPIETEEWVHPQAATWGLGRSDHSDPGMDFRCVRMEFFYFPAYRRLPREEQRAARKKHLDVCDQVVYNLVVVKDEAAEAEIDDLCQATPPFDPAAVLLRRAQERIEALEQEGSHLLEEIGRLREDAARESVRLQEEAARESARLQEEAARESVRLEEEFRGQAARQRQRSEDEANRLRGELAKLVARLGQSEEEVARVRAEAAQESSTLREELRRSSESTGDMRKDLAGARAETKRLLADLGALETTLRTLMAERTQQARELDEARSVLTRRESELRGLESRARRMTEELELGRTGRTARWRARLRSGDLRNDLRPSFQQLLDDSMIFGRLRGFRLLASPDLRRVPYLEYPLEPRRGALRSVLLAPAFDLPSLGGVLGVEIVSPSNQIVVQTVVPLTDVGLEHPTRFHFPAVPAAVVGRFWLRVFVRQATCAVRILEWRSYSPFGLGPERRRAFCGLEFGAALPL